MSLEDNPFRSRLGLLVPINNLQPRQQEQLLASSEILDLRRRDYVFRQGDRDGYTYYLLAGELEMSAGDQLIKKVIGGEAASFQPLSQLQPRQMSARAVTQLQVLRVDRQLLDQLLSAAQGPTPTVPQIEVSELSAEGPVDWLTALLQSELFSRIPPANAQRLLDTLEHVAFPAGAAVIEQGGPGDYYYVIQEGRCEVCRATSRGRDIRLAELGPGDTFGEEALVSNATRNATVRMLEDGTLGRLTKDQFIELIGTPVLHAVSLAEARAAVAAGARWLDVRFPEECQVNGLPGCLNLPLNLLRTRCVELDRGLRYVAYCDSGGRSSAAAFLLAQEGFDVCYVEAGAIDELGDQGADEAPAAPAEPAFVAPPMETPDAEEVATARAQMDEARRMLAAAEAARRDVERYVASRLADERARMQQDAKTLKAHIAEATRIKELLEARQREADAAAAAERAALEQRVAAYKLASERTLREKEARLQQVYQQQAARIEQLQLEHANAQRDLAAARSRIELETTQNRERLLAMQRLEADFERREREADAALAAREAELRTALRAEMEAERKRLEREFARAAADVAQVRREQFAAEIERRRAERETARLAEEIAQRQQTQVGEIQAALAQERARLEAAAQALEAALAEALAARAAAEAARDEALAQLAAARAPVPDAAEDSDWRGRIAAIEARAAAAAERLRAALSTESDAVRARDENALRLDEARESQRSLARQFGADPMP